MDKLEHTSIVNIDVVFYKITGNSTRRNVFTEKTGCKNAIMSDDEGKILFYWINEINNSIHYKVNLDKVIEECKEYYGKKFNQLFNEEDINELNIKYAGKDYTLENLLLRFKRNKHN